MGGVGCKCLFIMTNVDIWCFLLYTISIIQKGVIMKKNNKEKTDKIKFESMSEKIRRDFEQMPILAYAFLESAYNNVAKVFATKATQRDRIDALAAVMPSAALGVAFGALSACTILGPVSIAVRACEAYDGNDNNPLSTACNGALQDYKNGRKEIQRFKETAPHLYENTPSDLGDKLLSSLGMDQEGVLAQKRWSLFKLG